MLNNFCIFFRLNIFDKVKLFFKVVTSNFEKIYILAPKNIYFFLPLICRAKIFAITITNKNKSRPIKYLRTKLHYYKDNNRENRKVENAVKKVKNVFSSHKHKKHH